MIERGGWSQIFFSCSTSHRPFFRVFSESSYIRIPLSVKWSSNRRSKKGALIVLHFIENDWSECYRIGWNLNFSTSIPFTALITVTLSTYFYNSLRNEFLYFPVNSDNVSFSSCYPCRFRFHIKFVCHVLYICDLAWNWVLSNEPEGLERFVH